MVTINVRKFVLQNSVKFEGKPNAGAVIGKIVGEDSSWRPKMKELQAEVQQCIAEIKDKSVEEQRAQLQQIAPELLEKKKQEEHGLFDFLEIPDGTKMITGFPPEPSKYPHIGHAKSILLNYLLAKKYEGKFVLRFDDTNPKLVRKQFYYIHL